MGAPSRPLATAITEVKCAAGARDVDGLAACDPASAPASGTGTRRRVVRATAADGMVAVGIVGGLSVRREEPLGTQSTGELAVRASGAAADRRGEWRSSWRSCAARLAGSDAAVGSLPLYHADLLIRCTACAGGARTGQLGLVTSGTKASSSAPGDGPTGRAGGLGLRDPVPPADRQPLKSGGAPREAAWRVEVFVRDAGESWRRDCYCFSGPWSCGTERRGTQGPRTLAGAARAAERRFIRGR